MLLNKDDSELLLEEGCVSFKIIFRISSELLSENRIDFGITYDLYIYLVNLFHNIKLRLIIII